MSSIAQTVDCPKCGAPLSASARSATCSFCGTVSTIQSGGATEARHLGPATLWSPVWLIGWRQPASWLCPRDAPGVVVLPFFDPYQRDDRPPLQHVALADRLALATRTGVRSLVGYFTDGRGVVEQFSEPLATYEGIAHWVTQVVPPPVALIWAELGADDSSDILLRARTPALGDPGVDFETSVPLASAADAFLDWFVARGCGRRVASPGWYAPPPESLQERYQVALRGIVYFILAKNKLQSSLEAKWYPRYIEDAFSLACDPQAPPQCRIFPLTMTILAAQMGILDAGHRKRALDVARAATAPGDVLTWLSPHLLRELGAAGEADARARGLIAAPDLSEAYKTWLDSLGRPT